MTRGIPRPPFDPEVLAALHARPDLVITGMAPEDIPGVRLRQPSLDDDLTLGGRFRLSEHRAPGLDGAPDVRAVLWHPVDATGAVPYVYVVHGGGLITGTVYDAGAFLELAHSAGCGLASVDYRLAPEARYPAAVEDCYATLVWLADRAPGLGVDANRIIIAGVSAGGGLAAATALLARDRGGPPLAGQMLVCPMLDDRNNTISAHQMAGHGAWDQSANATGWSAYLGDLAGAPDVPMYAAPARAEDLSGLPPTFIDVGSAETFRDEDISYATRVSQAGGSAELHVWPGGSHSFDFMAPDAQLSKDARTARTRWLTRLLAQMPAAASPGARQ